MAATGTTIEPGLSTHVPSGTARLPYGWPIYALFAGFPVWYLLGFGELIWPILAVPMLFSLLARPRVRVPRGFGYYVLFLLWMLITGFQLSGPDRIFGFAYRGLLYFSAAILLLYVYNAPKNLLPNRTIVRVMMLFWMFVVAGGLWGIIAPDWQMKTLAESLIPARLLTNDFVYQLVHPAGAQVQTFLGYAVPRPKAPFVYTNDWGGAFALLVPFVVAGWSQIRSLARRNIVRLLAVLSLLPVVFSLNRTLWLCLVITVVYGSARFAIRGRRGGAQGLVAVLAVAFIVFNFGPTKQLIDDRVKTPHSNQGRETLYKEAADSVGQSPLLGYGAPRPSKRNPNLPSVGTQGQFWLVLFSHGIPGAFFFTGFLVYALGRTRRARSSEALWCHIVVLLAIVQMPFYGLLAAQLHIVMVAIALAAREMSDPSPRAAPDPDPEGTEVAVTAVRTNGWPIAPANGNGRAIGPGGNGNGNHTWHGGPL